MRQLYKATNAECGVERVRAKGERLAERGQDLEILTHFDCVMISWVGVGVAGGLCLRDDEML